MDRFFLGGAYLKIFSGAKNLVKCPIFFSGGPKIRGVQKSKKKVVFWHKKCEKVRTRHPIFFSQKFFNPPMRPKRHFALKDNGNHSKQKNRKNSQNFQNFQNFAKLFFEKKNRKIFFSRRLRHLFFFQ